MWKPGQIVTLKPDGIHNKRFRITKCKEYKGVCYECKDANMDIRNHNTNSSCPLPRICSCKIPLLCYPKPIYQYLEEIPAKGKVLAK